MDFHARAFWITAPGCAEIRPAPLRAAAQDEVLLQALYSGVSRGTESLVFNGQVPETEWQRMRAPFQEGNFPAPVKYGYASVGTVVGGARQFLGQSAFCLYPHQTHYVVPQTAIVPLPSEVPPERAVLVANLETAINGVWDGEIEPSHRILVIGAGTVGCLVAWFARKLCGCEVTLVDVNERRAVTAAALGVTFATPAVLRAASDDMGEQWHRVFHCSGTQAGLTLALELATFEGVVIEMSWFGSCPVTLPLGAAFHARRLTLKSSQVGHVAPARRAHCTTRQRLEYAISLLADPALDVLIGSQSSFDELPEVMPAIADGRCETLLHRVNYG